MARQIRYRVRVEEYGCDDPGEVFGLRLRLDVDAEAWEDSFVYDLSDDGARELIAEVEWLERAWKTVRRAIRGGTHHA